MVDGEYQGWRNWETWNVALYLNNEFPEYEAMRALARSGVRINARIAEAFVRSRPFFRTGTPDMRHRSPDFAREGHALPINLVEWQLAAVHWPSIARVIRESGEG